VWVGFFRALTCKGRCAWFLRTNPQKLTLIFNIMGRMHLPSSIQDAKGYFEKHKERARPNEPQPQKPLGAPPKHLTDDQKKLWREFKLKVLPGVAFDSDSWMVEQIVKLMDRFRKDTLSEAGANRLSNLLARFGMSPADRAKVASSAQQPKDELDEFLHKPKPRRPASKPVPAPDASIN
jgi:hypothetical protein